MRTPVEARCGQRPDERLLEVAHVLLEVAAVSIQVEDRVADQLAGPMVGRLAAAVRLDDVDIDVGRQVELGGLVRSAPERDDRLVLEQDHRVGHRLRDHGGSDRALEHEGLRVRDQARERDEVRVGHRREPRRRGRLRAAGRTSSDGLRGPRRCTGACPLRGCPRAAGSRTHRRPRPAAWCASTSSTATKRPSTTHGLSCQRRACSQLSRCRFGPWYSAFGVASMTIAPSRSSSAWITVPLSSVYRCPGRSRNPNASVSQSIAAPASS